MHFQPIEHAADDAYIAQAQDTYQVEVDVPATHDALDDVFGSGPSSPVADHQDAGPSATHPSDMRRLQTEHSTAGYREGVSFAKETSIQAGFDEGFSLGASVGLRAGQLLGMVEGIAEAVRGREDLDTVRAGDLVREAREELSIATIFKPDYWAEDGNWKYEVRPAQGADEVLFPDVAEAHPVIWKWTAILDEQLVLWKIDQAILDNETGHRLDSIMDEPIATSAAPSARKPLDW
ncbi:Essential protein Yae1, N terminal [Neonectria punicea]|uniref:Protein YAE1 n=1 Tax=Neonectria punicea TaxID=979145 RepID=A0ABR1GQ74_9HYPO